MRKVFPYILIVIALLVAGGIYIDKTSGGKTITGVLNKAQDTMMGDNVKNYGPAPEFTGISNWLNLPAGSQVPTLANLKGKVVLVDFWTYSCINCIRTLPNVTKWYDTYKDNGLVVIGVHTPEFPFEKVSSNVQDAINRFWHSLSGGAGQ